MTETPFALGVRLYYEGTPYADPRLAGPTSGPALGWLYAAESAALELKTARARLHAPPKITARFAEELPLLLVVIALMCWLVTVALGANMVFSR